MGYGKNEYLFLGGHYKKTGSNRSISPTAVNLVGVHISINSTRVRFSRFDVFISPRHRRPDRRVARVEFPAPTIATTIIIIIILIIIAHTKRRNDTVGSVPFRLNEQPNRRECSRRGSCPSVLVRFIISSARTFPETEENRIPIRSHALLNGPGPARPSRKLQLRRRCHVFLLFFYHYYFFFLPSPNAMSFIPTQSTWSVWYTFSACGRTSAVRL